MLSAKDARMLRRLLSKDEDALREFYLQHKVPLMHYLQRKLSNHDAEEVFQDSFIGFIDGLRNFRQQSSLKTFLYSIAKRKCIDKLRGKKFQKVLFSYLPQYVVESLAQVFLKDELDKKHIRYAIEKVLAAIPHDYAHVIRLKYIEEYTVAEISEKIHLPFKATESLLFRARRSFVKVYKDYDRQGLFPFKEAI